MPVSPLGNLNFINQNVGAVSTQASNEAAKEGFANMANLAEFAAKEKAVEKLEKVAQSQEVQDEVKERADEEEKQKHAKEEQEHNKNEDEVSEEDEFKNTHKLHRLDLSI